MANLVVTAVFAARVNQVIVKNEVDVRISNSTDVSPAVSLGNQIVRDYWLVGGFVFFVLFILFFKY
jgi:hypothetical protein